MMIITAYSELKNRKSLDETHYSCRKNNINFEFLFVNTIFCLSTILATTMRTLAAKFQTKTICYGEVMCTTIFKSRLIQINFL